MRVLLRYVEEYIGEIFPLYEAWRDLFGYIRKMYECLHEIWYFTHWRDPSKSCCDIMVYTWVRSMSVSVRYVRIHWRSLYIQQVLVKYLMIHLRDLCECL